MLLHYRQMDKDDSGTLTFEEFKHLHAHMEGYGYAAGSASRAFQRMDTDGSKQIEFNEYVRWILNSGLLSSWRDRYAAGKRR